ncbi:butyrophilin-like protein 2 [Dromiciops gliroides]|uniref:butyrophilin-like protein 2 n=1 Tax=Dromiciops gliroides TaxID=33562 RepID=UPI001CC42A3A|nr:butyrophilin-like protein 2 [Dromiciops gliroides]
MEASFSRRPTLLLIILCLFLYVPHLLSSETFTVSGPLVQSTLAWVGEDVLFSCHLHPKMDARDMIVKWVRGPLVVHLYRMGQEVEEVQAPAFQGRTKMLRQDMAEGKVTLRIHQVQLSDAGQYTCYFQAGTLYNEASFELQVAELPTGPFTVMGPSQPIQAKQGEDVMLPCHLSPKMDARKMIVKWFRGQTLVHRYCNEDKVEETQDPEFQERTELLKHDMAEGKVILRIQQVKVSDTGLYVCLFLSPDYNNDTEFELQVTEMEFGDLFSENLSISRKTDCERIVVVFPIVFSGFLVIYFFYQSKLWRTRGEETILDSESEEGLGPRSPVSQSSFLSATWLIFSLLTSTRGFFSSANKAIPGLRTQDEQLSRERGLWSFQTHSNPKLTVHTHA